MGNCVGDGIVSPVMYTLSLESKATPGPNGPEFVSLINEEKTSREPVKSNFVMKVEHPEVGGLTPPTVGKLGEHVMPTTTARLEESTAIALPESSLLPPSNVE